MENKTANQVTTDTSIDEGLRKLKADFLLEIENIFDDLQKFGLLSIEELQQKKATREKLLRGLKEARDSIQHNGTSQSNGTN